MCVSDREAFCQAVRICRFDDWSPAIPAQPRIPIGGNLYATIREVCALVAGYNEQLPDEIEDDLFWILRTQLRDQDLQQEFGKDRSYAVIARASDRAPNGCAAGSV